MSLGATRVRLEALTRELLRSWDETKASWSDARAREFERMYLQELEAHAGKTLAALEKLDGLLKKVRDECE